jgi:predicted adenine nucleotide alpha hydrolase (AANH) superfamily ATPase
MIDGDYNHQQWCDGVKGMENEPERGARCLHCFKMRLLKAAEKAKELNIELFTTTLASSRWKDLKQINEAGFWAAEQVKGTLFWDKNWRKDGLQDRRNQLLKENNFYNQQYCGCEFSMK